MTEVEVRYYRSRQGGPWVVDIDGGVFVEDEETARQLAEKIAALIANETGKGAKAGWGIA